MNRVGEKARPWNHFIPNGQTKEGKGQLRKEANKDIKT